MGKWACQWLLNSLYLKGVKRLVTHGFLCLTWGWDRMATTLQTNSKFIFLNEKLLYFDLNFTVKVPSHLGQRFTMDFEVSVAVYSRDRQGQRQFCVKTLSGAISQNGWRDLANGHTLSVTFMVHDVMACTHFPFYCPFVEGICWISLTKIGKPELWCSTLHWLEHAGKQAVKLPVIKDPLTLMWHHCNALKLYDYIDILIQFYCLAYVWQYASECSQL